MNRLPLLALLLSGCVLDRTGQSATEAYRRELVMQGARVTNLEDQIDKVTVRVTQLEELNRDRGQQEILKMETLDQVRQEVARLRGDLEVLSHQYGQSTTTGAAYQEDAAFRLSWLEARADQLEAKLKLAPPPPPTREAPATGTPGTPGTTPGPEATAGGAGGSTTGAAVAGTTSSDPDELITLAEQHLAQGRPAEAEAALDRFLQLHPGHKRAAEARYRRAEAAFNAKNYAQAVLRFQEVIDQHKDSQWASWAMLRQGESFDAQGQPDNARLFYEDVVRLWPKSKAATEAKRKLK